MGTEKITVSAGTEKITVSAWSGELSLETTAIEQGEHSVVTIEYKPKDPGIPWKTINVEYPIFLELISRALEIWGPKG